MCDDLMVVTLHSADRSESNVKSSLLLTSPCITLEDSQHFST